MFSSIYHYLLSFSVFEQEASAKMIPDTTPSLFDYSMSLDRGFLPPKSPLKALSNPYYFSWESIISDLHIRLQEGRLREAIDDLPVLSTANLISEPEWQRAYAILAFFTHAYIWGGEKPSQVSPNPTKEFSILTTQLGFARNHLCAILGNRRTPWLATHSHLCCIKPLELGAY